MRSYQGERDANGRPTVWVINKPEGPPVSEIAAFAADLRAHVVDGQPVDVDELMVRKHDLLDRIEASKHRTRQPLRHVQGNSPDGFEWGYNGNGPADLAHAILTDHSGTEPTPDARTAFCEEVIARLPTDTFQIPDKFVDAWTYDHNHRPSPEVEATTEGEPTPAEGAADSAAGQAWAVTDTSAATAMGDGGFTDDPATASALIAACEQAWADIQGHHPEVPDAVMVLGSGVERGRLVKLGHWWGGQWLADGQARAEVLLAGEALHLQPHQVFEVLLHEAAHGINSARRVKDTSRGGRYHNKHYAATAREVLLKVRPMPPYGMASTELSPEALDRYGPTIERLGDAMRIARTLKAGVQVGTGAEGGTNDGKDTTDGQPKADQNGASCGCGRKMRMAPKTLAVGPVVCGVCGTEFTNGAERQPPNADRTTQQPEVKDTDKSEQEGRASEVIDRSFLTRRQAALAADTDTGQTVVDPVTRVLDRQRARLEAVLATAPNPADEALRPLAERRDRLERILQGTLGSSPGVTVVGASASQAAGAADLTSGERSGADHAVLRRWYERYGTDDEQPLPAATATEEARRERLARALLKADGTLTGPAVTTPHGTELQAGDRVHAGADHGDLPTGTPGTIERVDPDSGTVDIDFATWGRLQTTLTEGLARDLRHDYTDIGTPDLESAGVEL